MLFIMKRWRLFSPVILGLICIVVLFFVLGSNKPASSSNDNDDVEMEMPLNEAEEGATPQSNIKIEVNIPATEMTVYENNEVVFVKPVAIGQRIYPTPEMDSFVKNIEWNPSWSPPPSPWARGASWTAPGPKNPVGRVKMAISNAILFHGTNKESSVGTPASHGCMRMFNKDAMEVAWFLQSRLSDKNDPKFKEVYDKNTRTTYVVKLNEEVPVTLLYKPVVFRSGVLKLYPDYYGRLAGHKIDAIMGELINNGVKTEELDQEKLKEAARNWMGKQPIEINIESLK